MTDDGKESMMAFLESVNRILLPVIFAIIGYLVLQAAELDSEIKVIQGNRYTLERGTAHEIDFAAFSATTAQAVASITESIRRLERQPNQ